MNAKWGWITQTGILAMLFVVGCKSSQPDLKPPKQAEVFNPPPANVSPFYPKQAFNTDDSKPMGLDPGRATSGRGGGNGMQGMNPGGMSPGGAGSFNGPR
jgi:hypothetical protein